MNHLHSLIFFTLCFALGQLQDSCGTISGYSYTCLEGKCCGPYDDLLYTYHFCFKLSYPFKVVVLHCVFVENFIALIILLLLFLVSLPPYLYWLLLFCLSGGGEEINELLKMHLILKFIKKKKKKQKIVAN